MDNDGLTDILSGCWALNLYIFKRLPDGDFAPGALICNAKGEPIKVDYGTVVHAADWDADGDHDLIVGVVGGAVHFIRNHGSRDSFAFGEPERLKANGDDIEVPDGDAAPAVADWNGDGKQDLLVGTGAGSVLLYTNVGTAQEPELAAPVELIAQTVDPDNSQTPRANSERGIRAKPCITDWNNDGLLDLLVGDHGREFTKQLSGLEREYQEEFRLQQEELRKSWAGVFRDYRAALKETGPVSKERAASLRNTMLKLKRSIDKAHEEEIAIQTGRQYHGRVWVFLRKK